MKNVLTFESKISKNVGAIQFWELFSPKKEIITPNQLHPDLGVYYFLMTQNSTYSP